MTSDEQDPEATGSGATDAGNGHGGVASPAGHQGAPRAVEHFSVAERAAATKAATLVLLAPRVKTLVESGKSAVTALPNQKGSLSSAFKDTASCQSLGGS